MLFNIVDNQGQCCPNSIVASYFQRNLVFGHVIKVLLHALYLPADLTVSKRPGTRYRIKIHFAVFNHLYLLFSFMKLIET